MTNLFTLVGEIVIKRDGANSAIKETVNDAKNGEAQVSGSFNKLATNVGKALNIKPDGRLSGVLTRLGTDASTARQKIAGASSGGFGLGAAMGVGMTAVTGLIGGIGSLVGETGSASDAMQKFKSTMQFAGIDDGAIDKASASAKKYADDTVYDLQTITNTTAQLAANGIKDYTGLTQAAGNVNAVAGGNADTFKSVAMVMTQTAGAGKLTTENWNQLADAIPGASGKLQEAMKKNGAFTGNFRDAMADGQISADEFNKALSDLGNTDVAKKAATSTATFEGAIGNLQASIVTKLNGVIDSIGKENITKMIGQISDGIGQVIQIITNLITFVVQNKDWLLPIASAIGAVVIGLQAFVGVMAIINGVMAITSAGMLPVIAVIAAIVAVVALVIAAIMHWRDIVNVLVAVWQGFVGIMSGIWNGIKAIFTTVIGWITAYIRAQIQLWVLVITTVLNAIKAVITAVWNGIKAVFSAVIGWITAFIRTEIQGWSNIIRAAMNLVRSIISSVWNAIIAVFSAVFGTIRGVITSAWNGFWSIINGAINLIRGGISNGFNAVVGIVSGIFNNIKNTISNVFSGAVDIVSGVIDRIKGLFNFQFHWPHIPLPHFSASGSFNPVDWITKGEWPKIGVDWYAKGGIMNQPTVFGMNGNRLQVGGEAGREAVVPLNDKNLNGIGAGAAAAFGIGQQATDNSGLETRLDKVLDGLNVVANAVVKTWNRQSAYDATEQVTANRKALDSLMMGGA